ncbi:MAG TPA: class II fumarate hydratase, partial [bacterium]|nr:class II fumarate hydratase [bacterium]
MKEPRTEEDSLGSVEIPSDSLWGASTQRAIDNFPVSARRLPSPFIRSLGLIKKGAAEANGELKLIDRKLAHAIASAADEVALGKRNVEFPVDVFQTGSGTSTNMNANEVIARLANIELRGDANTWNPVHPNDHVNRCQSSNDVIPSAIHVAACTEISGKLIPSLEKLRRSLSAKALEFDHIVKIGRTHLMDAMPVRLGQEFAGWARQVEKGAERMGRILPALLELALGGTAVGTGFGAHPDFAKKVCRKLSKWTGLEFEPAKNPFEALSSHGPCVEASGALKATAGSLVRIADDIRLMASGPRLGFAEIKLPALAPGSSIMPGKVNPVIPEMVVQVGTQVAANDLAVTLAAQGGHLELSTQLPVLASNLLESVE